MARSAEKILPITWAEWDGDMECLQFTDVEFTDDWAHFKKGDKVDCFTILLTEGQWEVYTTEALLQNNQSVRTKSKAEPFDPAKPIASGHFRLVPVESK